ncbi:helix-hairpin-helix domain-containing protein [Massilia sp. R2A-15]|uniref:ComEA family DNA-binding protein n=1 Tax=Massilia sp. R2A-15 TaxID=3064278 RepID=UPI002734C64D|nr:helix-hairpin-helix domain-containing protein [Massilia sp. R2A-15]WLI90182.1 helix-hairpin-helix domain-containing protein [Massilia sp. R2A-15]
MIKKLMLAVATMIATMGFAFAQVDVNKADAAALDSVKGVGPKLSKAIIDERAKGGEFKDWADFEKRVKGVGPKNGKKLSMAGLQVGGKSMDGAEMKMDAKAKPAKAMPDAKPMPESKPMPEAKPMPPAKAPADMKAKPAAAGAKASM